MRDFIADHRVLRLPPPHAVAGAALQVQDGLQVESRSELVNDRLLLSLSVRAAGGDDVELQDCELLLHSTRWLLDEGKGKRLRRGEVSVPVPLSSLMLLSQHPVSFPVPLSASARVVPPLPVLPRRGRVVRCAAVDAARQPDVVAAAPPGRWARRGARG